MNRAKQGPYELQLLSHLALALRGKWLWGWAALAAVLGAALSKGPGLPQAVLSAALVVLAFSTRERWRILFSNRRLLITVICAIAGTMWLVSGQVRSLLSIVVAERREQFGLYVLTQCRVLPQYLWRMVFPLNLCSDHLVQTTLDFSDVTAWICATFVLALTAGLVFAWVQQWKPWALILALGLAPLLLRWLYVVSEMMVEYRTYPANALRCPVTRGIDLLLVSAAPACRHGVSLRSAWNFRTPRSSKKC